MLFVLDSVTRQIAKLLTYPPEHGGAIFGLVGKNLITRLIFDSEAETTSITYVPSVSLTQTIRSVEAADPKIELKGIVHSHPNGLSHPSAEDESRLEEGLALNPQITLYVAPIVTRMHTGSPDNHQLVIEDCTISFFGASRRRRCGIRVQPVEVREVPVLQDLEQVRAHFGGDALPEIFTTDLGGVEVLAGRLQLPGIELLFLASELYPATPPLLLVTDESGQTQQLQVQWSLDVAAEDRLIKSLGSLLTGPRPFRRAFGPAGGPALTADPRRAELAGWEARFTGEDPQLAAERVRDGLFARSAGLLSTDLQDKRILLCGLGSGGSYAAEQFVRSGVGHLTLIDPETVEPANLSRTVYDTRDLNVSKPSALARRLLHINPLLSLSLYPQGLQELEPSELDSLVRQSDLVFAATDDQKAQLILNRFAYGRGTPALLAGMYAGARGGEVVICLPERTPCYMCATYLRHQLPDDPSPDVDYGTGRTVGEVALGVDIQHLCSAAVKMAFCLLLPDTSEAALKHFLTRAIEERMTYLVLSTVPEYWFFPSIFQETPGQYAYQSIWLTPDRRPECPVCGTQEYRVDPLEVPLRNPRVRAHATSQP